MKEVIKKIDNLIELNETLARATGSPVYAGILTGLETTKALIENELNKRKIELQEKQYNNKSSNMV